MTIFISPRRPPLRSTGFSLIELLLVLGVIAVLLVAAFVVYPQVRDRNQANAEAVNIRAIQTNVRNLYATRGGNYYGIGGGPGGNDYGLGNQARIFPPTMNGGDYSAGVPIKSSWGGEVYVWNRPAVNTPFGAIPNGRSFGIAYMKVPKGVCVQLVTALAASFESIAVGSEGAQAEVLTQQGINIDRVLTGCAGENPLITFTSR